VPAELGESTATVREALERCGLRCTRQRELIYAALLCTRGHPTAEEILSLVRAEDSGLSLATVYNTLDALTECRLVQRIPCPSGHGPCRFDAITSNHVHVALDDRVIDLPEDLSVRLLAHVPAALLRELEERLGVRVAGVRIQITASTEPAADVMPRA
jgi:Fe2+ or Zn2+ uptake regulation protein